MTIELTQDGAKRATLRDPEHLVHWSAFNDCWPACMAPPVGPKSCWPRIEIRVAFDRHEVTCPVCKAWAERAAGGAA